MGWMGKMVGGSIGFVVGGPLGALAGAAFGHMFDSDDNRQNILADKSVFSPDAKGQYIFLFTTFSMLAKIAKAGGAITTSEMNIIRRFMVRDLRLNAHSRMVAEQIFHQALNDAQPFSAFADRFYQEFRDTPEILEMMVDMMLKLAAADGFIHKDNDEMISGAARVFQMPGATVDKFRSRHIKGKTNTHYAVLGCSPNDSNEVVKKQYRKKVKEYHPDTIAAKNLPEDFTRYASNRFREIQEAWEVIRRERNM